MKGGSLRTMIAHLDKDELPDERAAKNLIVESKSYEMIEEVLHHKHPTDTAKWCMDVPKEEQAKLLQEQYGGKFAGHFPERKVWKGMQADGWWLMYAIITILVSRVLQERVQAEPAYLHLSQLKLVDHFTE